MHKYCIHNICCITKDIYINYKDTNIGVSIIIGSFVAYIW